MSKKMDQGSNAASLQGEREIDKNIKYCCEKKINISLKIDGSEIEFLTMFVNSDLKKGSLTIDSLVPKTGNERIKQSESLLICYSLHNITHCFRSSYIESIVDEFPAIKISFPEKIDVHHRRSYFRVEPDLESTISVRVKIFQEPPLETEGSLRDLSEGGFSFSVPSDVANTFKPGTVLDVIEFVLSNAVTIKAKGVVRNIFEAKGKRYNCGVELIGLTHVQADKIYSYVVERQREELQKLDKLKV